MSEIPERDVHIKISPFGPCAEEVGSILRVLENRQGTNPHLANIDLQDPSLPAAIAATGGEFFTIQSAIGKNPFIAVGFGANALRTIAAIGSADDKLLHLELKRLLPADVHKNMMGFIYGINTFYQSLVSKCEGLSQECETLFARLNGLLPSFDESDFKSRFHNMSARMKDHQSEIAAEDEIALNRVSSSVDIVFDGKEPEQELDAWQVHFVSTCQMASQLIRGYLWVALKTNFEQAVESLESAIGVIREASHNKEVLESLIAEAERK